MTFKEMEGFGLNYQPPGWFDGLSGGLTAGNYGITTGRATGGRAAHINDSSSNRYMVRVLGTPQAEGGFAVAMFCAGSGIAVGMPWLMLREVAATTHLWIGKGAGGTVQVRLGSSGGTLLGESAVTINDAAAWIQFGVEYKIADAGGYVRVYVNGDDTPVVDVSGVDTRNAGTVGQVAQVSFFQGTGGNGANQRITDWVAWDTAGVTPENAYPGDVRVETLRPNATGAAAAWVGSDGNSVDNWQLIDDDSTTTDYIGSGTSGARDLSELTNLIAPNPGDVVEVLAVQMEVLAAKSDAGAALPLLGVQRKAATTTVSTETLATGAQLSTSYSRFRGAIDTTDPDGDPWTYDTVNALQAGVEVGV